MRYQAYKLASTSYLDFPQFIKDGIATRDIRITADGEDVHVLTGGNLSQVEEGEYIVLTGSEFFVCPELLYLALTGQEPTPAVTTPQNEHLVSIPAGHPDPHTLGEPPYSPAVLARSARARSLQAEFDALPIERQQQLVRDKAAVAANPATGQENAHVEGADALNG